MGVLIIGLLLLQLCVVSSALRFRDFYFLKTIIVGYTLYTINNIYYTTFSKVDFVQPFVPITSPCEEIMYIGGLVLFFDSTYITPILEYPCPVFSHQFV